MFFPTTQATTESLPSKRVKLKGAQRLESGKQSPRMVQTRHLDAGDPGAIVEAAQLLRQGHLVVLPTDTVYGVAAEAFNAAAINRLYQVKQRPLDKGIPILLADFDDLEKVSHQVPEIARRYISRFWPGPLTLIVPKRVDLPAAVSPNQGVAVRIPGNDAARALIRAAGGALAVTSANRSGRPPAQTAAQALAELSGWVAAVLDDGPSPMSIASTIVSCLGRYPKIVREGPISAEDLALVNQNVV